MKLGSVSYRVTLESFIYSIAILTVHKYFPPTQHLCIELKKKSAPLVLHTHTITHKRHIHTSRLRGSSTVADGRTAWYASEWRVTHNIWRVIRHGKNTSKCTEKCVRC